MINIRTFIGRKLNYINGILRRQIELDRYLKSRNDIKLSYVYYDHPKNIIDFFSKRYILYPLNSYFSSIKSIEDIVYHITFQYLGDLAHFLNKAKTIITCHDMFTFIEKKNIKNPLIIQKYSLSGLKKCKYIISISDFTKNELISKFNIPKEKVFVIKNGINCEMFKPIAQDMRSTIRSLYPNHKKLLHVGTEESRKDFLTLLKAFYIIKKSTSNIKLIRIGEPKHSFIIKKFGLENDIIYLKNISNSRLNEIYNLCDFLVYPSLYEGWGAPPIEAASCGTPVICSDIPIFREIYRDFPLYFPPKDFRALAKEVLNNIDNEDLKLELGKKGIQLSKCYSWEKSSMEYLKLAKKVIENM